MDSKCLESFLIPEEIATEGYAKLPDNKIKSIIQKAINIFIAFIDAIIRFFKSVILKFHSMKHEARKMSSDDHKFCKDTKNVLSYMRHLFDSSYDFVEYYYHGSMKKLTDERLEKWLNEYENATEIFDNYISDNKLSFHLVTNEFKKQAIQDMSSIIEELDKYKSNLKSGDSNIRDKWFDDFTNGDSELIDARNAIMKTINTVYKYIPNIENYAAKISQIIKNTIVVDN